MIRKKLMITLAASFIAMAVMAGCGKNNTSVTEVSGEDIVQSSTAADEDSGNKILPTTAGEKDKKELPEEKESVTTGKEEKQPETSAMPANIKETSPVTTPVVQQTEPATKQANAQPEQKDQSQIKNTVQPATQPVTKTPEQPVTQPATKTPAAKQTEPQTTAPQKPKVKTMWDAPYDVEGIKAYIIEQMKANGYRYADEYWKAIMGDEFEEYTPDNCAWDNYCTTTAGPQRYYDKVNKCAVGHQHYKWSEPFNGSIAENAEASTEWMVNHAIHYWDSIYGKEYSYKEFSVYVEAFDDGCVIFYILAM